MQIVIDIDEEDFEIMKHNIAIDNPLCPLDEKEMVSKVANGTPLPKGHGRLIDADDIFLIDEQFYTPSDYCVAEGAVNDAPTIIEADTESEDNNE